MSETKEKNQYLIPGAIIIAGMLIGLGMWQRGEAPSQETVDTAVTEITEGLLPITDEDHLLGSKDADVFLIVFSDYRCGYCGLYHETVKEIFAEYDGRLAWVYRHAPYQPGGKEVAVASECVTEQLDREAFWDFSDRIFKEQRQVGADWYRSTIEDMGGNVEEFEACIVSGRYDELIARHTMNAQSLGVQGTPYSVLLTREGEMVKFSGAQPIENVRIFVERALRTLE